MSRPLSPPSDRAVLPADTPPLGPPETIRITATRGWVGLGLAELWRYRELLWFLTVRDIKVRYKQTALGASWAILQPLATAAIFTIVFGRLAHVPSDGVPYAVFALAGLVVWTFFANAVSTSSLSLVNNTNMVTKVYFPRLCVPIAATLVFVLDLLVSCTILFVAMAIYGVGGGFRMLLAVPYVLLGLAAALGLSMWLSAIAVRYRDVRYAVPFLMQLWLFITPVAYPSSLLSGSWHAVFALNPMVGVVEGFRWALLGTDARIGELTVISGLSAVVLLVTGAFYFRRMERSFADVV